MKQKINLVGLFMIYLLFISATVFASPKDDMKQIWEEQTFDNARYHVTVDTKMALFGSIQNTSTIDVKRDPLFIRSEDSMTIFGTTKTATSYLVQEGDTFHIYSEDAPETKDSIQTAWVRYDYTMPSIEEVNISDFLLPFDKFVRSVKPVMKEDGKQIYHVTLDGRTFYKSINKYYENALTAPLENGSDEERQKKEMMRSFTKELLETWKNTDAVTMMVMVKDHKIVGMQTELAPQMNAMVHIIATALDSKQGDEELKTGALAEAFLATESMKLTIVEVGEAEYSSVPEKIVQTAIVQEITDTTGEITSAMQGKNATEPGEKTK